MFKAIAVKVCALLMGAALLMVPALGRAEYGQGAQGPGPPPIEQPLVREGTLAVKLLAALNLGTTDNEVEAETLLGQAGISPKNGWIADYPVTPDIVGELETALAAAADAHRIAIGRDDAVSRLDGIMLQLGVEVNTANAAAPPAAEEQNIVPVEEIYNYYYDEGPPIITYYAPPVDYYYLYSWVPYPFWCGSFWFGGFFVLNDFDRPLFFGHGHHHHGGQFVSNHFRNPVNNGFARIDPATRSVAPSFAGIGAPARFTRGAGTTAGGRPLNGPTNGFTARPPGPTGAGMNLPTRLSPWTRSNSAAQPGRFATGGRENPSGAFTRNRGYAPPSGSFDRYHGNNTPAASNFSRFHGSSPGYTAPARSYSKSYAPQLNSFANSRAYSAPARSFATHNYSPSVNSYRGYSPPARSFAPRGGFSAPSFHGGFSSAPSFHGGFSAGPSFRGGGGFSGGRGRR